MKKDYLTARAQLTGGGEYPHIRGCVRFRQMKNGVLVTAEVRSLPGGGNGVYGFHIHDGESCTGTSESPFADADGHFNPDGAKHPYHAGDLPPLFGNDGYAFMSVLTDRFTVDDIIGRTVIVHRSPDDFTTQPSGSAGEMIACGRIVPGGR